MAHNIGGACISYAMECFPSKVSKAIFVAAAMISNGQRAFDVFVRQVLLNSLILDPNVFVCLNILCSCSPASHVFATSFKVPVDVAINLKAKL